MRGSYFDAAEARAALDVARRMREEAATRRAAAPDGPVATALATFTTRLESLTGVAATGGRGGTPVRAPESLTAITARLVSLARELGEADVRPTAEQVLAVSSVRTAAKQVLARWEAMRTAELGALNAALTKAGVEPITVASGVSPKK
jgi:hypothetical protein